MTPSPVQEKSRIDLAAMSERECFQKEQEVSQKEPISAKPCAKQSVSKDSFDERDQSSKALRHRPYPIDAATCTASVKAKRRRPYPIDAATCAKPVIIDAEESIAGVKREAPLIDAATGQVAGKDGSLSKTDHDDTIEGDDLTDVSDVTELTTEQELLKAAGLDMSE